MTWPEAETIVPGARNELHAIFDSTEKEKSETVDIDIILQQMDERGHPIVYTVQYKFELEE